MQIRIGGFLCLVASLLVFFGCGGTLSAYREAKGDLGDLAYVISEHYASLIEEAAELQKRVSTPTSLIQALRQADDRAKPTVLKLRQLRKAYLDIQNAQTEAQLQQAINDATAAIADMQRTVTTARGARIGMLERLLIPEIPYDEHAQSVVYPAARTDWPARCGLGTDRLGTCARSSASPL